MTVEILNLSLIGKAKTILLHFSLQLEDLRDQGSLNGRNTYMSLTWHVMNILSRSIGFCVKPTSKRWV